MLRQVAWRVAAVALVGAILAMRAWQRRRALILTLINPSHLDALQDTIQIQ